MLMTGSGPVDAELAFTRMTRSRRYAALARRLRRGPTEEGRLDVYDPPLFARRQRGVRAVPLAEISGTLEPSRARLFDRRFRPAAGARRRWQGVWLAEHRGLSLPPIELVAVGDAYAIRDGHHRVSVAKARGAVTIDATVEAA